MLLHYFGVTSVRGTRYPVEWYPDPWHVYPDVRLRPWDVPELNNLLPSLRIGETVLVRITSPPYVNSCKISLWDNFRGHLPNPKGENYAQFNNNGAVEYFIKKRRTTKDEISNTKITRQDLQNLPNYQYIASRNPIHLLNDIKNWDPTAGNNFPTEEPPPDIRFGDPNVFRTTLGYVYCDASSISNLTILDRHMYECGIAVALVELCLNDDRHVLNVRLADGVFGPLGEPRGIHGEIREIRQSQCDDFIEVKFKSTNADKIYREKELVWYMQGALRSKYQGIAMLRKTCTYYPEHEAVCEPDDVNCVKGAADWNMYTTERMIEMQRESNARSRASQWTNLSRRIIRNRWYFCRMDPILAATFR